MKKTEENRYPHAATLFKFCKEALAIRYQGNVKVIDQDVGAILGYDPADCSHWKKGKKNIRALATLKSIANHLNIDERLLIDIASGKMDLDEAVFEFRGYGTLSLQGRNLENLKKEFFKDPNKWRKEGSLSSFEELFDIDRQSILKAVNWTLETGYFREAPIYIPEVFKIFQNIAIVQQDQEKEIQTNETVSENGTHSVTVTYKTGEMKPYVRFLAAKALFKFLVSSGHECVSGISKGPNQLLDIQSNIFASMLLVPDRLLCQEVERIDSSLDIVDQLANTFWISKTLMNQRLRDYLQNL